MSVIGKKKSLGFYSYLTSRGSSIAFAGMLMLGLGFGSVFCIGSSESASLLQSIVANQLELQATQSYLQLMAGGVSGFATIFIFVYLCINSRKGHLLIYAVPLLHGLSLGSLITAILVANGYSAFQYILLSIFVPKSMQTLLLLSVCNKTARYSKEQYRTQSPRKAKGEIPILLYIVLFGIYFAIEAFFVLLFRGLL